MPENERIPLLEVKHVSKRYGNNVALWDVNLKLYPGEIHGLIGGNGAGKSTLLNILSGARKADSGEILIDGVEQHFSTPKDAMDKSVAIVYQELSLLPHLSVAENIARGNNRSIKKGMFDARHAYVEARRILNRLGGAAKDISPDDLVYTLNANQKQIVEIARAVGLGARIILLDEPTSSLNQVETENLFHVMRDLSAEGLGFLFVTHRMAEIRMICNVVSVVRDGRSIIEHQDLQTVTDDDLVSAMLGRFLNTSEFHKTPFDPGADTVLKIVYDSRKDSPITVHRGEVLGITGLTSSGRSALLRSIWGIEAHPRVSLEYLGKPFVPKGPKHAMRQGIGYVTEDRKLSGLYLEQRIAETIMGAKRVISPTALVHDSKEIESVVKAIRLIHIKVPSEDCYPGELSGGNQQKLIIARWLIEKPDLLLLDEPTRGVDIATKFEIYDIIHRLAKMGTACLVVSSEVSELVRISHRILILKDGVPANMLEGDDVAENLVLRYVTTSKKGESA